MNCYIFDVDGTLIDSSGVYLPALQQMLDEYGYAHTPEMLKTAFGMTGRQGLRYFGIPEAQHDEFMHRWESLAYENLLNVKIYDGILDTLHALREGGSKLGIVTSRTRAQFRDGVKPLGLDRYFDTVVCSDEVAHPKPAPDAALECLQRLRGGAGCVHRRQRFRYAVRAVCGYPERARALGLPRTGEDRVGSALCPSCRDPESVSVSET